MTFRMKAVAAPTRTHPDRIGYHLLIVQDGEVKHPNNNGALP
jgi:hypothetical protein